MSETEAIYLVPNALENVPMIYFAKTDENAIIPSKRDEDGAFDIYACFEEDFLIIDPHETITVPTGIASAFSNDYVAILHERGSTGIRGIGQRAGVIDSGYRGSWMVPVTNHNTVHLIIAKKHVQLSLLETILKGAPFEIYPYDKAISQCVMLEVPKLGIQEIKYDDLLLFESERGTGKLGSSGK